MDEEYRVKCDTCGASIVTRNNDDINRIKHLKSLDDPDEMVVCTGCAYQDEIASVANDLVSVKPNTSAIIIAALSKSGVPSNVLSDRHKVSILCAKVTTEISKISKTDKLKQQQLVNSYGTQINGAVDYIRDVQVCELARCSDIDIDKALIISGVPSDIIQSESRQNTSLVKALRKMVRKRLGGNRQVSPLDASAEDYEMEACNAASDIVQNRQLDEQGRCSAIGIDKALITSGVPSDIIQSKNIQDKSLVVDIRKMVRKRLREIKPEQVSPLDASAEYYEIEACNAASDIVQNCQVSEPANCSAIDINKALITSGVPSDIIRSDNRRDKSLVAALHGIVRRRLDSSTAARISNAKLLATRMRVGKKDAFQAHVCIICDCFIIGTERICILKKDQIKRNEDRIGVKSYDDYCTKQYTVDGGYEKLPLELVKQYEVPGFEGLLLSPRSQHTIGIDRYEACQSCYDSIRLRNTKSPPKFAIANGFVIGHLPKVIKVEMKRKDGTTGEEVVNNEEINDVVRAVVAPIRAYGYTFSYFAGAQQSIQGHYIFYEVDQTLVGAVMNNHQQSGANPHVHIVLGGRFTPSQKRIVREKTAVDTRVVTGLLTWFIKHSKHRGFKGIEPPAETECPTPKVEDDVEEDFEIDKEKEGRFGGTYHFSSAYAPSQDTGVHNTQLKFTKSLLERTPPTLLAYGGDYASGSRLELENIIPTAFPWGIGGPTMPRRNRISRELRLAHYGRLSLDQFMKGDFCLLANHMLDRQLSYTSAKVKCRTNIDGVPLAEKVSRLTVKDLEDVVSGDNTNSIANQLLTSVSASCKAMGHTSEAAAHWRRVYFALSDRHGLNAFMLTVTPNDLVNFSVRVIALAGEPVRST